MTRPETGKVEVEGGTLAFEAAGEGAAVVFLHAGLWDRRTWDGQFDVFSRTYRVVRYDARGYGHSSRPEPGRPYSHVEDLIAVMDATAIERAALVGNSMGGGTALDCALTHSERVAALVLAVPAVSGLDEGTPQEETWYEERNHPVEALIEAGELPEARELELRTMWAQLGTEDPAGARIKEIALDNLHEITMDESGARGIEPPAVDRLEQITCPTLVIPADHDPPWTARIARMVADRIPNARLVPIAETDHVIPMRRPDAFNREVLEFIGEVL